MLNIIWDTRGYFFWLLVVSLFCWILQRLAPWRKEQKALRNQIGQDFFWLIFNGHYAGIFRYLINSPRMHVWHHDTFLRGEYGKNFAVVFSMWDWLFGTAYMPARGQPQKPGFEKMEAFPRGLLSRLIYPLWRTS
ncbi:MAG: sterol desaturase family protein [bacterium]